MMLWSKDILPSIFDISAKKLYILSLYGKENGKE